jgi:hypothetical protein
MSKEINSVKRYESVMLSSKEYEHAIHLSEAQLYYLCAGIFTKKQEIPKEHVEYLEGKHQLYLDKKGKKFYST